MACLVAVCRDGEEDFPFLARQIPLYIDDTLTVRKCSVSVSHMVLKLFEGFYNQPLF